MKVDMKALTPEGSKYRLPSRPTAMEVTPEMASDWLSYRNHPRNRPLSKGIAGKYQKDMENGLWHETPEPMLFDTDGWIISAQHRLKAVANSGKAQRFMVVPGQSRDIFDVIDQGYKRTPAHMLGVPNATTVAGAARYLAALADQDRWSMPRFSRITTPEIVATFRAWPELDWLATDAINVRMRTYITASPHLAMLAQARRTEHADKIPAWIEGLTSGVGLAANDPRAHLRERFLRYHASLMGSKNRDHAYSLMVKAWNAFAEDGPMSVLRHSVQEPIARVIASPIDLGNEVAA